MPSVLANPWRDSVVKRWLRQSMSSPTAKRLIPVYLQDPAKSLPLVCIRHAGRNLDGFRDARFPLNDAQPAVM